MTDLGMIDIEADHAYERLAADALEGEVFGVPVRVCSLESLRTMKRAAGRAIDREDLDALG